MPNAFLMAIKATIIYSIDHKNYILHNYVTFSLISKNITLFVSPEKFVSREKYVTLKTRDEQKQLVDFTLVKLD